MKRGQVTIFVIIGLAILLIAGIFLLMRPNVEPSSLAGEQAKASVTRLVESCLTQVGEESLRELGAQGGRIDAKQFRAIPGPDANAISLSPAVVPLWHEVTTCAENSAGCVKVHMPLLCENSRTCPISVSIADDSISIQQGLEILTQENLARCLDNFRATPDLIVKPQGKPQVTATIRDDSTLLSLIYPLRITATDKSEVDVERFAGTLDVRLPDIYRLASDLYLAEREGNYLEIMFLHMLTLSAGIDEPIPPFRDIQFYGSKKYWVARNVQKTIEEGILPYYGIVQVANAAESYVPLNSPDTDPAMAIYADGVYRVLTINTNGQAYPLAAQLSWPGTPMHLSINGGKQVLKPRQMPGTSILKFLGGFKFLEYRFRYDASFPVLVEVRDPYAFNDKGFALQFGLEANVRNNYPLNVSAPYVTVVAPDETIDLSSPEQVVDHTYTIKVLDRHTGEPIEDAAVTYTCGLQYDVGSTEADGTWTGKLPYCIAGGAVTIEVLGYGGSGVPLQNTVDDAQASTVEIRLWPTVEKRFFVYKRSPTDIAALSAGGITPASSAQYRTALSENDTGLVTVVRVNETPYDEEVPLVGVIELGAQRAINVTTQRAQLDQALATGVINQDAYALALQTIESIGAEPQSTAPVLSEVLEIVPGRYTIDGLLIYGGLLQIPEDEKCSGGLMGSCQTLPAVNFTTWVSGGVLLTDADAIELTEAQVYGASNVTLFLLEQPLPLNWSALETTMDIEQYQTYDRKLMVAPET